MTEETPVKERPILFNGPMVRAILEGRKVQTRRLVEIPDFVKDEDGDNDMTTVGFFEKGAETPGFWAWMTEYPEEGGEPINCPYGKPGDRLWVRETFRIYDAVDECGCSEYPCNCPSSGTPIYRADGYDREAHWKPSIHMPRKLCRITLEVTGVRVERLNDITEEDALSEGILRVEDCFGNGPAYCDYATAPRSDAAEWYRLPTRSFQSLWELINGTGSWDSNPWVWVVEFKRLGS